MVREWLLVDGWAYTMEEERRKGESRKEERKEGTKEGRRLKS